MGKPRIVYIHGDGHLHWSFGWAPALKQALEQASFPTFFELFPDSIEARARYWLPFIEDHVRAGAGDVLLGWSSGSVAAMRYAETNKLRGLALVAPYYTDLGSEKERRSGYFDRPWDFSAIKANAGEIALFHGDEDPYISQREFSEVGAKLDARVHRIAGAGHFNEQDTFPQLAAYLIQQYG